MSETLTYQRAAAPARDQAHPLYAQTMRYVAATAALFALGAYLGGHLPGGVGIAGFIVCGAAGYATRRDITPVAGRVSGRCWPSSCSASC